MDLLLGIDIGTTGTKAVVADIEGNIVHTSYKSYSLKNIRNNHIEQDAEDWWKAVIHTVRDCTCDTRVRGAIKAMSISSQGGSLVVADKDGNPLRPAIIWMDTRAAEQMRYISDLIGEGHFQEITGSWLSPGCNMAQIKWLKDNEPGTCKKAARYLSTIDYINFKLTGRYAIDLTSAQMTKLLNIRDKKWSDEIVDILGISASQLPDIIPSGNVIGNLSNEAAELLGLSKHVMVISGGHDQYCAALGSGTFNSGDVMLSTGTAWVVLAIFDSLVKNRNSPFAAGCHIIDGKWGFLSSLTTGGVSLEWFRRNFAYNLSYDGDEPAREDFKRIDSEVTMVNAGSDGMMFFPHFTGAKFPRPAPKNKATLLGIDLSHGRYSMARSIMEGVAFEIKLMLDELKNMGVTAVNPRMLGGAVKSSVWPQIVSDVLNMPVRVLETADVPCLGAVILAGKGAGFFESYEEGYDRLASSEIQMLPDSSKTDFYKIAYASYKNRLNILKELYQNNECSF